MKDARPKERLTLRSHLLAAFVLFHVVAIVVAALPAPGDALSPSTWENPTVKVEVADWAHRLGTDPDALRDRLITLAKGWLDFRARLMMPFRPYIKTIGCEQSWTMFVAGDRFPTRFQLEARRAGEGPDAWETLFEERSAEHRWRARFFENDRVRGALLEEAWPRYAGDYHAMCEYLARELFRENGSYDAVRCAFLRTRTPSAAEVRRGVEYPPSYERGYLVSRSDTPP